MGEEQWEQQRKAALTVALEAARRVVLPPPRPDEPLAAYVTRVIVEDQALLELKACSRAFPGQLFGGPTRFFRRHSETGPSVSAFPIEVWPRFSPAWFSSAEVIAGHDGLDLVGLAISERTAKRLDWIWENGPSDMLDVRMAREPRYDLGDKLSRRHDLDAGDSLPLPLPRDPFLVEMEVEVLKVWRAGARRRDVLTAMLCDGIRSGTMIATGFLTNDVNRRSIEVQPAWWSDPLLTCGWRQGELRPLEEAPSGTPHFRGLALSPEARQKSAALKAQTRKPGRPTGRDAVLATFDQKYGDATPASFARRGSYAELATELINKLKLNERKETVAGWISQHVRGREADK